MLLWHLSHERKENQKRKRMSLVELLEIGDILHFCSVIRRSGFGPDWFGLVYLVLQPAVGIEELTTIRILDLYLVFTEHVFQVEHFPQLPEIPRLLPPLLSLLDEVLSVFVLGGGVVIGVDMQHRELHSPFNLWEISENISVHDLNFLIPCAKGTEPPPTLPAIINAIMFDFLLSKLSLILLRPPLPA